MKNGTLSTGEVAKYCGVHYRTVIRWVQRGRLNAYQLPDRGDRRIAVDEFVSFCLRNNIPLPAEFQNQRRRILIIEDQLPMARSILRSLKAKGFECKIAEDGFKAGSMLEAFHPCLVTLDLRMPGLSGIDVLKHIRSTEHLKHIRVLVASAASQSELAVAMAEGADDIIEKPFTSEELQEKVRTLTESIVHTTQENN